MTRYYGTLIGDGRQAVAVEYDLVGEPDDFDVEIEAVWCEDTDVIACLLTQQIVEIEMDIIKHHKHLMSGMADI